MRVTRALRLQLLKWRAELSAGAERVGWKVGRGLVEGEEHLEPVIGYLTSATRLEPGGVYLAGSAKELRVDAELALEVGAESRPARYGAALELVDVSSPRSDFETIVARNVWHRAVVFGPLRPEPPPEIVHATVRINGATARDGEQRVDPLEAVRLVERLLGAVGEQLQPGDRIIAGSIVQLPVVAGNDVRVDLGVLGQVGVKLG